MTPLHRRRFPRLTRFGLLLFGLLALAGPGTPRAALAQAPEDVIVLFREGTDAATREAILRDAGALPGRTFRHVAAAAARLVVPEARARLAQHPAVTAVLPDRPVRARAKPGSGGGAAAQVVPAGVQRVGAAPGLLAWTGAGVGVAVVDTGLDFAHADLQPLGEACFSAFGSCLDDHGHGTHVGGIIAARDNAIDVVGVAPAAILYAVKVLDAAGNGSDSTVMAGLDWILTEAATLLPPIRVVNMSLGRPGTLDDNPALRTLLQQLHAAGVTVVVSAGNDPDLEVAQQVPATYPEVLAVASSTALTGQSRCRWLSDGIAADTASYFTTDGAWNPATGIGVTVSAPGAEREDVARSCFVTSVGILSLRLGGGTTRASGTSMAAPHVAGVVALLWEQANTLGGSLPPEEARGRLRASADRVGAAPLDSPTTRYTYDGEREGILWAPGALQ